MGKMVLLGVGTAVPDADRECTHMVWVGEDGPLLIDAAGGTYGRARVDPARLQALPAARVRPSRRAMAGPAPIPKS